MLNAEVVAAIKAFPRSLLGNNLAQVISRQSLNTAAQHKLNVLAIA